MQGRQWFEFANGTEVDGYFCSITGDIEAVLTREGEYLYRVTRQAMPGSDVKCGVLIQYVVASEWPLDRANQVVDRWLKELERV